MNLPLLARALRFATFASLLTSAGVAILLSEHTWKLWRPSGPPTWAHFVAPACFATFLTIFALDRLVAVRGGQEAAPRAWMQVSAAAFLLCLLAPQELVEMRQAMQRRVRRLARVPGAARAQAATPEAVGAPLSVLLDHEDETVRAAACELLGAEWLQLVEPDDDASEAAHDAFRLRVEQVHEQVGALGQNDPSGEVREACSQAYSQMAACLPSEPPNGSSGESPRRPGAGQCPALAPCMRDYDVL